MSCRQPTCAARSYHPSWMQQLKQKIWLRCEQYSSSCWRYRQPSRVACVLPSRQQTYGGGCRCVVKSVWVSVGPNSTLAASLAI
jgi:hypothetical protein